MTPITRNNTTESFLFVGTVVAFVALAPLRSTAIQNTMYTNLFENVSNKQLLPIKSLFEWLTNISVSLLN